MTAVPASSRTDTVAGAEPAAGSRTRVLALTVFRIVTSGLFVMHGLQGLLGWFGGADGQGGAHSLSDGPSFWASAIELVAGGLVLLGLFARPAAVLCSGTMAFAYFTVHQPQGLVPLQNSGEPAALYAWLFLLLAVLGPGTFTLASLLRRGRGGESNE